MRPSSSPQYSRLVNGSPVYYGWVILGVSTLGLIMTSAGQTYGVSIFLEHFITDLGLSRSLVSSLYTAGTLIGSLALPVVGRSIDQYGLRRVFIVVTMFFGVTCLYMGFVQNALMLGIGFVGLRMLGQGSLYLVCLNAVNRWWVRRRGLAIGVSGLVASLVGVGGFPVLLELSAVVLAFSELGVVPAASCSGSFRILLKDSSSHSQGGAHQGALLYWAKVGFISVPVISGQC